MPRGTFADRRLELYVRALGGGADTGGTQAARVRDLARRGTVAEATVHVWGDEVSLSTTAFRTRVGKCILDRIATFRAWADKRGATMAPFFETRTVTGAVTGEAAPAVRLPVACLAEYADGDLVHVAPYRAGETDCSVTDRLDYLATTRPGADGAAERAVQ